MPEGGPHNQEYTEHHPEAIVDRNKAELVGHATKRDEEAILQYTSGAEAELDEHARLLRDSTKAEARNVEQSIQERLDWATHHRENADLKADEVSRIYDETTERIAALKNGGATLAKEAASESTEAE